jgi:cleavage and polyadenylation specificity factor subunit 1
LVLYQPYYYSTSGPRQSFLDKLRWGKVSQPKLATQSEIYSEENDQTATRPALRRLDNVGGYSTVVQLGASTNFVLKEASSAVKVIRLTNFEGQLTGLDTFHSSNCDRGFITVDESGTVRFNQLPTRARYGDSGWPMSKLPMGEEVSQVCYFEPKNLYAIATAKKINFELPEDDHHKEWAAEEIKFLPLTNQGFVKLLYPGTKDWKVIHSFELDPSDVCLCMTTANLATTEYGPGRKPFLCAGTLGVFGEDQASRGKIFVFDVIDVVPEPGKPETGHRLKVRAKEDVKGAVTAMREIGPQGFLLVAQGQRAMVRGLIEADKLVPVAFQDIQCFVTSAKVLRGTGMILMGDVAKGVWFTGYTVREGLLRHSH